MPPDFIVEILFELNNSWISSPSASDFLKYFRLNFGAFDVPFYRSDHLHSIFSVLVRTQQDSSKRPIAQKLLYSISIYLHTHLKVHMACILLLNL